MEEVVVEDAGDAPKQVAVDILFPEDLVDVGNVCSIADWRTR